MSLLNQISSLQEQSAQLSSRRHQEAEEDLIFGTLCLEKFESTGFREAELLKEACRRFIHSIQCNSRDIRPHLALIYLFTLIEDYDTAQIYVASAQAIDVEHPFLAALQEFVREARRQSQLEAQQAARAASAPPAGTATDQPQEIDYDALYDRIEAAIPMLVRKASQLVPPDPSLQSLHIEELQQHLAQLEDKQKQILAQIKTVEEEIDAEELRTALQPLHVSLQRLQQNLGFSQQMRRLYKELRNQLNMVEQVCTEAQKTSEPDDLPILEENVEALLDQCDQFADRLDELEQQKVNIDELLKYYQRLVSEVESFQDLVDQTTIRLKGQ